MKRHHARKLFAGATLWLAIAASAHAADCLPKASQGWIRLPPVAMPMMAGFVRIENPCAQAAVVVSAESLSFGGATLHETREVDGVNKMREVERLRIEPGKTAELKPGSLHLMLYRPYQTLKEGDEAVIVLKLQDGRSLPITFSVRKAQP